MRRTSLKKLSSLFRFLVDPRKDIEVFGMFGPGNLGDEAMLVAAEASLPDGRGIAWQNYSHRPILKTVIHFRPKPYLLVGGGTLIHGGNSKWLDYVEMRSKQGANIAFFGTGIAFTEKQISDRSEAYSRWSKILSKSSEVHLRGPRSVEICSKMGVNARVFGDFAFLLHDSDLPRPSQTLQDSLIGLNIGECLGDQREYERSCSELLRHLHLRHTVVFHVVIPSDIEATHRVIRGAGLDPEDFRIEHHYYDPRAFINSIRDYRCFFGLKLHAAGLAMVAGVPTLMVAYLPKALDFMGPLGELPHMLIDLPLEIHPLINRVEEMLEMPKAFVVEDRIGELAKQQRYELDRVYSRA